MSLIPDLALGVEATGSTNAMAGVTKDATSGIYCPATAAQWTTTLTAAGIASGGPTLLYLMQEPSGNLAETITGTVTWTAANTPGYQAAVSGWTRLAVTSAVGTTQKFNTASASLPDPATSSYLMLCYAAITGAPTNTQQLIQNGNITRQKIGANVTPRYLGISGANTATGTVATDTAVHPFVLRTNITSLAVTASTHSELLTPTYAAPSGKAIAIGGNDFNSVGAAYLYTAIFTGAAAELSDAQLRTLLQTLGWTITW